MGKSGSSDQFYFLGLPKHCSDYSHEIKRHLLLGREAMTDMDSELKKQRYHFANKGLCSKSYGSSSSRVQMWELDYKEGWVPKNWCFRIVVLGKTHESPLDSKEIKPVNPKGINPEYSLEGLMLKLQYFGHLMKRANSLEKTLMLGKIEGRRRRERQRLDGITDSKDMGLSMLRKMMKNREAWRVAVHGVSKSQTWLSDWITRYNSSWGSPAVNLWNQTNYVFLKYNGRKGIGQMFPFQQA